MKFNSDDEYCSLKICVDVENGFLGVSVDDNGNYCTYNSYNGDHAYIEIEDTAELTRFVEFCKNVVKEWELRNENK